MTERVLVVDDSKEIRDFLVDYVLEPKGFQVLTASNGLMGLEMAMTERPDLMITDQQMPQLTGLELLTKLQEHNIDIPTILMTGQGSEETAVAAFRLGIRDYIIKPIDAQELSDSIDNALRESRLQREHDVLVDQLMESNSQLQRIQPLHTRRPRLSSWGFPRAAKSSSLVINVLAAVNRSHPDRRQTARLYKRQKCGSTSCAAMKMKARASSGRQSC